MMTEKFSKIYLKWFEENKNNLAGSEEAFSTLDKIKIGSLDFITQNCGKIYQNITDNSSLNADIANEFCVTFVKHFWLNRIGYYTTDDFFIKLSAFLAEKLPVWADFYRELVIERNGLVTSFGTISVNTSGNLHYTQNNTNNSSSDSKAASSSDSQSNTNGTQSTTSDTHTTDSKEVTNNTNTTTNNSTQTNNNAELNLTSDTPQDNVNISQIGESDDPINDLDNVYNFANSTSNVNAKFNKSKVVTQGNTKQSGGSTESGNSDTTANSKTTSDSTTKSNSTTNTTNNTTTNTNSNAEHMQASTDNTQTITKQRNANLASLARELSSLTNGAYLELFKQAKKAGLFLAVY